MWQQWINGILGLWVIIAAFTLGIADSTTQWTFAITGIIVAALGFWGAAEHSRMTTGHHA